MLTLEQLERQYPESIRPFRRNILREYLQYKILEIIFNSEYAAKLSFIGGTALRIVYGNSRFSEDLDFDNFGLTDAEFDGLASAVRDGLAAQGIPAEVDTVGKGSYRCRVKLPGILFANGLSPNEEEKVLIQIDSLAQGFPYRPDRKIINKFDVFSQVFVSPLPILLSQKLYASINRKRAKGRDFFDVVFLLSMARPDYAYLVEKIGVGDADALRRRLLGAYAELDFRELGKDVRPFLFNPAEARKVEMFREYISSAPLE